MDLQVVVEVCYGAGAVGRRTTTFRTNDGYGLRYYDEYVLRRGEFSFLKRGVGRMDLRSCEFCRKEFEMR